MPALIAGLPTNLSIFDVEDRTLPSTWRLLKRQGAVLYEGHNRIGLGTYPNLLALLTGEKTDIPFNDQLIELRQKLISKAYREHDYLTFHMEDCEGMSTFGNGFNPAPADFYYRPFFKAMTDAIDLRCGKIGWYGNVFQYLQEKSLHEYQFDALHDFLEEYKAAPTFSFLHLAEYTHNDQNLARLYDEYLSFKLGRKIKYYTATNPSL